MGETIVVKLGGNAIENVPKSFFHKLKQWKTEGKNIVLVHGGGTQIDHMLRKLNIETKKKGGLRVTTTEMLEVVNMVLFGSINKSFVLSLKAYGIDAIGLNGCDGNLLKATAKDQKKFGFVGDVIEVNTKLLQQMWERELIPVIAPLGVSENAQLYNINADTAACKIASALNAEQLILLTDVAGVIKEQVVMSEIEANEINHLIKEEVISGGMIPKVTEAVQTLLHGVKMVRITNGLNDAGTIIKKGVTV